MIGDNIARSARRCAFALSVILVPPLAAISAPLNYQPPPSPHGPDAAARSAIEAKIKDSLVDPDSAEFKWIDRTFYMAGGIPAVCGQVNSKNRMGGYSGYAWFAAELNEHGEPLWFEVDDNESTKALAACESWGLAP
jgi:hypothetical protein